MQWATKSGGPWNNTVLATAAKKGHLDVLQWARAEGFPWDTNTWKMICKEAVDSTCYEDRVYKLIDVIGGSHVYRKCPIQHYHIIKWAKENGFDDWKSYITKFVIFDDMKTHRTVLDLFNSGENPCYPFDSSNIAMSARYGHLSYIQWLRDTGCSWDEETCFAAAFGGHLHVLQWIHSQGCPWNERTFVGAAIHGHLLPIIEWARANGCPWNEDASSEAASNGYLGVLQWLRSQGCPWNSSVGKLAALNGHLHILQWADNNGLPWKNHYCEYAARKGHYHIVKWACDKDLQNWRKIVRKYVHFVSVAVLVRIHVLFQLEGSSQCLWDERDMAKAARINNLQIIEWLRDKGCAWDESACFQAARNGLLHVLQWLRFRGCPWNEINCANIAILKGKSNILD